MITINDELNKNVNILRTGYSSFINVDDAIYLPPDQELADITGTPLGTLDEYNNWYYINNDYCYVKELKCIQAIINELLGEHLSKYMNLPTIEYQIAEKNGNIHGLVSRNFKNSYYNYHEGLAMPRTLIRFVKRMMYDKDLKCNETTREELTAYVVRNYYAAQKDRVVNTLYASTSREEFLIAPLFDYESSFIDSEMLEYIDPMISCTFTPDGVEHLRQNNKYFQEYVNMIFDYSIEVALKEIEHERQICIPVQVKEYYKEFDSERKEFIQRMGLRRK